MLIFHETLVLVYYQRILDLSIDQLHAVDDVAGIPYLVLNVLIIHLCTFHSYQMLCKLYIYKFIRH